MAVYRIVIDIHDEKGNRKSDVTMQRSDMNLADFSRIAIKAIWKTIRNLEMKMTEEVRLYKANGEVAGLPDICKWWMYHYPEDIFVTSPPEIIAIRNEMKVILDNLEKRWEQTLNTGGKNE